MLLQSAPVDLPPVPFEPQISAEVRQALERREDSAADDFVQELESLGNEGDDSALELLGEMHQQALLGVARDAALACDYYERIGDRRADALHNMATCYYSGNGREQDLPRARALYRAAAEAGWIQSRCALGNMFVRGEGGAVDAETGIALCRSGADTGDINALTDLGGYLLTGKGVERDPVEARQLLEKAAEQGQVNASFLLGQIYQKGDGVAQNLPASRKWLEQAFARGRSDAAYHLMITFFRMGYQEQNGEAFIDPKSLEYAMNWARTAARRDPDSERRETARSIMPQLEILLDQAE